MVEQRAGYWPADSALLPYDFTSATSSHIPARNLRYKTPGRVLAATMLGLSEVPVIRLGHLDEAERRAYRIADNKLPCAAL